MNHEKNNEKLKVTGEASESLNDPGPSLIKFIFKHNKKNLLISSINRLLSDFLLIFGPLILEYVRNF